MKLIKKFCRKKAKTGSFYNATPHELEAFMRGIGKSAVLEDTIKIRDYPFEPAIIYPGKEIHATEISAIHLNSYPPTLKLSDELIFVTRECLDALSAFAERNSIETSPRETNWDLITEPFLDTEFDETYQTRTMTLLNANGISGPEVEQLRAEIADQMYKYNFDTMIWEWAFLGLNDVLLAMRPKYEKEEFEKFYWRAMEIEQRNKLRIILT